MSLMSVALAGGFFTTSATRGDHSIRKSLTACVLPSTLPTGVYSFLSSPLPQPESVCTCALGGVYCPPQGHRLSFLGEEDAGETFPIKRLSSPPGLHHQERLHPAFCPDPHLSHECLVEAHREELADRYKLSCLYKLSCVFSPRNPLPLH